MAGKGWREIARAKLTSLAIIAVANGLGSNLNDKFTTINNSLK